MPHLVRHVLRGLLCLGLLLQGMAGAWGAACAHPRSAAGHANAAPPDHAHAVHAHAAHAAHGQPMPAHAATKAACACGCDCGPLCMRSAAPLPLSPLRLAQAAPTRVALHFAPVGRIPDPRHPPPLRPPIRT